MGETTEEKINRHDTQIAVINSVLAQIQSDTAAMRINFKEGLEHIAAQITSTYTEFNKKYVRQDNLELILKPLIDKVDDHESRFRPVEQYIWKLIGALVIVELFFPFVVYKIMQLKGL